MSEKRYSTMISALIAVAAIAMCAAQIRAADAAKEQQLLGVLKSDAKPAEKAITCKFLAIYGTKDAVPALAALLPDKELSSWARIALESIPDAAADAALRQALGKTEGRLLIGIINSIAYRHDANAIDALIPILNNADTEVACAAAVALGKIGGDKPAEVLKNSLSSGPAAIRSAVAEGCILCAERALAASNRDQAIALYDAVRKADLPKQRILEGIRGAIIARGPAGTSLLVDQLRSSDNNIFEMAVRTARELPSADVTSALVAEIGKATPQRQALLIYALADRGDRKALPAVLDAVKSGPMSVRIVAASVLEQLGDASAIPVLLNAASGDDPQLAQAARTALVRLQGQDVDADLFKRLQESTGAMRRVLIELAEQRRLDGAMPLFIRYAQDPDAGVRAAAIVAIGSIGDAKQAADLAGLLQKAQDAKDRADIEKALMSVSGRWGAACVQHLLPLSQSSESATRAVALNALACCGGADALSAVKTALDDKEQSVQDQAVRTLATWSNRWPDDTSIAEPLLNVAKSGKTTQQKVLALRGYLQFIQGSKKLSAADKISRIDQALPLISRDEEKRLAVSVLGSVPSADALDRLAAFAADSAVSEEACSAIVGLAGKNVPGLSRQQRQKALQAVIAHTKSDTTKAKAEELMKR